jgi:alkanesulfonate monooxygenase SsuD/methylene tetrahydromethanopterin reductase-like flavin-dependent oxidoreductase (luciferase family)
VWRATAQADAVNSPLPDPETAARHVFSARQEAVLESLLPHAAEGAPETVGRRLTELADSFEADELMVMTPVHDLTARKRSFELIAEALPRTASA